MLQKNRRGGVVAVDDRRPLSRVLAVLFVLLLQMSFSVAGRGQQEEVTVTAVEIPVRVLLKGEPVRDLTKEDFEIFENGIRQDITQFEVISRKIASAGTAPGLPEKPKPSPRLFLLIFNIFDYDEAVGEAVDLFFGEIFQRGDRLLALTEGRLFNIESGKDRDMIAADLKATLKKFKSISTMATVKTFQELEREADLLISRLRGDAGGLQSIYPYMNQFLDRYQRIWNGYRNQFLASDFAFYESLAGRIRLIEGEKWAFCFQQREIFPKIRSASRLENEIRNWVDSQVDPQPQVEARLVQAKYNELQRSFDFSNDFSKGAQADLFLGAGITFHLILLKSVKTQFAQDFELKEVGQDFENNLRAISRSTGGYLAFSNQAAQALREASSTEDVHYLLVYSPKKGTALQKRDIEVRVRRPGVEVISPKTVRPSGPPPLTIADFRIERKGVGFSLRHFQMAQRGDTKSGQVDVRITIFGEGQEPVFDEAKTVDLFKDEAALSLNFDFLKPGSYFIIVTALDRVANTSDVYSGMIQLR